jgi:type II secretory pathway pseudopilin PulG
MLHDDSLGLTLVELLVVVGVISVLMGLVVAVLNPAHFRNQAQDSRRISELGQIRTALEMSFADNNQYPSRIPSGVPTVDPDGVAYTYCPSGDKMTYNVCVALEVTDASTVADCGVGTIGVCATSFTSPTTSCCVSQPF